MNKGKGACEPHTILHENLSMAVLAEIQQYAVLANDNEQKLIQKILDTNSVSRIKNVARYEKIINEKEFRLKEIDSLAQSLFEEKMKGELPSNIFSRMAKKYDDEQLGISEELKKIRVELAECKKNEKDISRWINKIKKYLSIEKLTRSIVVEMIEHIEISNAYEIDGKQHQDIKIVFKFQETNTSKKIA